MSRHRRAGDGGRPAQHRGRRTVLARFLAGGLIVLAAATAWLAWSGLRARDEVDAARSDVSRMRAALVSGDQREAEALLADARAHASTARTLTRDPLWRLVGAVPFVGRTPRAITQATDVLAAAVDGVLPDLVSAAGQLDPSTLRQGDRIDLAGFVAALPSVDTARQRLAPLEAVLNAIDLGGVPRPVAAGVGSLQRQLDNLSSDLTAVSTAAEVIPPMLGSQGTRHYLVVFQNPAEARGTGGLVGAYALVTATKGQVVVTSLGADSDLQSARSPVLDLGPAYRQMFGDDPALWANSNLSAHFPYAARQQLELWRRQHGQQLDGVVAVDPVVLGYLLDVTGPARMPDGTQLTGDGIADLTMRQVYARYPLPEQNAQRKAFLQAVAATALAKVLGGGGDAQAELKAMGRGASERRLLVYSAHPDEQALIAGTAVAGVVDDTPGPYAGVALDNASGSKVDYYTEADLAYVRGCQDGSLDSVTSTVTLTLIDRAPEQGLPEYVAYRLDRGPSSSQPGRGGDGSVMDRVLVYLAEGAKVSSATLDGSPAELSPGVDGAGSGRPVMSVRVELAAGQTRVLVLQLVEPAQPVRPVRAWVAPLVQTPVTTVTASTCR